jgi:sensor histidine kinase YesM
MKNIKKGLFPFLIAASALSVSASAAFYSVSGLSKLFAGASFEVIIMAGSLEVAKLVIASLLYQYWSTLNKLLRTYLVVAATVLVLITSMGIYGFLSAAYQQTYSKLSIVENEKEYIQQKVDFYEKDLERYDLELESILSNINTLSATKSGQTQSGILRHRPDFGLWFLPPVLNWLKKE